MERSNSDNEVCAETDQRREDRRRAERRKRDEPVLLDTRAPRERRGKKRRRDETGPGENEAAPDTRDTRK